jgi:hypothetical protein
MEISVLQSLIDRTSNEIENKTGYLRFLKECGEYDDKSNDVRYVQRTIAKLVKIQKALKKEIADGLSKRRLTFAQAKEHKRIERIQSKCQHEYVDKSEWCDHPSKFECNKCEHVKWVY